MFIKAIAAITFILCFLAIPFSSMDGTFRVADQLRLHLMPPHPWMELRALSALPVSKSYTLSIDGIVRRTSGSTGALGVEAIPLPMDGTRSSVE